MKLFTCLFIFLLTLSFLGCVKDTNFDQLDDVVFTPEIELDLIYFNLDAGEFFDQTTNTPRFTVRDTTALEFLDSNDITGSIQKIDFLFDFNNSIPRSFEVDFEFLSIANSPTYNTGTIVQAGSENASIQTLFIEEVEGEDLNAIESASKVVVSVTIPEADAALAGNLTLQSKATYFIAY